MQISDETLARARGLDPEALEAVLAAAYPAVFRMSAALTGSRESAGPLANLVMQRGVRVISKWRPGAAPENWFYHHTLLAARSAARPPDDPRRDPLAAPPGAAGADARYVALVRTLRNLPPQQAEAFILHHGERLNARLLGVAMDCSTGAAENHLRAAVEALVAFAGGPLDGFAAALSRTYAALTPPPDAVRPAVRRQIRKVLVPIRFRRLIEMTLLLALLGAAAYAAWRWRVELVDFIARRLAV